MSSTLLTDVPVQSNIHAKMRPQLESTSCTRGDSAYVKFLDNWAHQAWEPATVLTQRSLGLQRSAREHDRLDPWNSQTVRLQPLTVPEGQQVRTGFDFFVAARGNVTCWTRTDSTKHRPGLRCLLLEAFADRSAHWAIVSRIIHRAERRCSSARCCMCPFRSASSAMKRATPQHVSVHRITSAPASGILGLMRPPLRLPQRASNGGSSIAPSCSARSLR